MNVINTENAPKAIGPYSQATMAKDMLFVSGQIPFDPITMTVAGPDIQSQTKQSIKNVLAIVKEAGLKKENITKIGIFMKDMGMFAEMNEVYSTFFSEHKPARFAVEVARLPKDVLIEIDAIAIKE
jgi:2-iminobutanoate/2-iminopropanoate deaminase